MEFTKEQIVQAIKEIDDNPDLKTGRNSSTYDLKYEGKNYPPILVLSEANKLQGKGELLLRDFKNDVNIPFGILRSNGFEIVEKDLSFHEQLMKFLKQADEDDLKISDYRKKFFGLDVNVSFGKGAPANIPWISFLREGIITSNGIYPVYLYYKKEQLLILAYGISETTNSEYEWYLENPITISQYFSNHNLGKPFRYGKSYIFKVYNVENLPDKTRIDRDLIEILTLYKSLEFKKGINGIEIAGKPVLFDQEEFINSLRTSGLIFHYRLVNRFIASLLTKPFVILTGLSGSGKTKLAQSFVQWICADQNQYRIIPVGADWTNREPLLGYPNALKPEEYVKPDSGVLDLIIEASNNPNLPYFLILDEMNLSHVERYFADFLSVMESKESIPLHSNHSVEKVVPAKLKVPSNLFVIGTVNIDETTNMFSPKVLDRANTIEFRVSQEDMENFLSDIKAIDMDALTSKGASLAKSFLDLAATKEFAPADTKAINAALVRFFGELKKTGAEFGYRSATEIMRLINQLTVLDDTLTTNEKVDIAIMQKLLPKLHGSRRKLCPVLETLGSFCVPGEVKISKDVFDNADFDFKDDKVLLPLSLEKITRMYRGAIDNGFASFAEA